MTKKARHGDASKKQGERERREQMEAELPGTDPERDAERARMRRRPDRRGARLDDELS